MRLKRLMFTAVALAALSVPAGASGGCDGSFWGWGAGAYDEGGACFVGPPCPQTCYLWGFVCFNN